MIDKKKLAEIARNRGICKEGFERIASSVSIEELLNYYIEGIDFCLEHDFPSKEYLKKHGGEQLSTHGIYVDRNSDLVNPKLGVFLGRTVSTIDYSGYQVSELFVKDVGFLTVSAKDNAFVVIDAFDDANVNVKVSGFSKVLVNVYGNATVSVSETEAGVIKVVRKNKGGY